MWNEGPLIKISSKTPEKEPPQGNILEFFLLDTLKSTFWKENLTQRWIRAFSWIENYKLKRYILRVYCSNLSQPHQNFWHLVIYVQLLKEVVSVEILRWVISIRTSFSYLWNQPSIKSVFLSEKRLWSNFYESGPSFTF